MKIADLRAYRAGDMGLVEWRTLSEIDHAGFFVVRLSSGSVPQMVTTAPIPGRGDPLRGAFYRLIDPAPPPEKAAYWLIDVDVWGVASFHGPASLAPQEISNPLPEAGGFLHEEQAR